MSNRELLEEAKILKAGAELSREQENAIDDLSEAEVSSLISAKGKLFEKFPPDSFVVPITHHN